MRVFSSFLLPLVGLAACSSSTNTTPSDAAGATSGATTSSSTTSSSSSTGSGGSGGGKACATDAECGTGGGAFCYFADSQCGKGAPGTCFTVGVTSDCGDGDPLCTCAGVFVDHACGAQIDGRNYSTDKTCYPSTFACGPTLMCKRGVEDCKLTGMPSVYSCEALPPSCTVAGSTCTCYQPAAGCTCENADDIGDFNVVCM